MAEPLPLPSLSEVRSAIFTHLSDAADYWNRLADLWENSFTEIRNGTLRPGGTIWEGVAADSAQGRTDADVSTVRGPAWQLRDAAGIASRGYEQMEAHRRLVLEAVDDATSDGYEVGDDGSVRATDEAADEDGEGAKGHAEFIRYRLEALVAADRNITTDLDTTTAGLDGVSFGEGASHNGVQLVDHHVPLSPPGGPFPLEPHFGDGPGEPGGPEFVIGPPTKPHIDWDEDFKYGSVFPPTPKDYLNREKWKAKLEGGRLLRPDLDDATEMYKHYWENNGRPIKFDYEEAYREDSGVRINVEDQISRAQRGAEDLIRAGNRSFSMTGDPNLSRAYPTTENWQKAIGAYQQWSSADVKVDGDKVTMTVTVHAEDHYNFNRSNVDIATGAPDNENGRFTELGWAKPFDSHGGITRTVTWQLGHAPTTSPGDAPPFNPGREDRADGRGSPGGVQRPTFDPGAGSAGIP